MIHEQSHRGGWNLADVLLLLHHLPENIIFIASSLLEEKENSFCISLASDFLTLFVKTRKKQEFIALKNKEARVKPTRISRVLI